MSRNCYWERMKDFGGGVGSSAANGNVEPGSPVTVKDHGFQNMWPERRLGRSMVRSAAAYVSANG